MGADTISKLETPPGMSFYRRMKYQDSIKHAVEAALVNAGHE